MKRTTMLLALLLAGLAAAANDFDPVPSTLEAWYSFENAWTDGSGNGNTLTAVGGATFSNTVYHDGSYAASFAAGADEGALRTDGNLSANFPGKSTDPLTVTGWIRLTVRPTAGNYMILASKYDVNADKRSWQLAVFNNAGTYQASLAKGYGVNGTDGDTGVTGALATITSMAADEWYGLGASTGNDGSYYIYNTTEQESSGNYPNATTMIATGAGVEFVVGARDHSSGTALTVNGYIDEVTVWSEVLTPTQIKAVLAGTYGAATGPTDIQQWWARRRQ